MSEASSVVASVTQQSRQRVADNRPLAYIRMKQLVMFHENPTGNVDNARRRSEIRYK